jgi:hypothetical protein
MGYRVRTSRALPSRQTVALRSRRMNAAPAIEFVEVGPRDGLQNEAQLASTADKFELVTRSLRVGARRIEVTSFVPKAR